MKHQLTFILKESQETQADDSLPSLSSLQLKHDFNFKFRLCRLILMFNSFYGRLASMKEP